MCNLKVAIVAVALSLAFATSIAAQSSPVAVAPMQFRGGMPVIEVKLNRQGPFVFAIDTGAGMQADIDPSIAEQLKLEPVGKIRTGDPSGQNNQDLEATRIATLEFGAQSFATSLRSFDR